MVEKYQGKRMPKGYVLREVVYQSLENETLLDMAHGKGPMLADELPEQLRESEAFKQFAAEYGWPSEHDAPIVPIDPVKFRDLSAFAASFVSHSSVDYDDQLQNFRHKVTQAPNDLTFDQLVRKGEMGPFYGSSMLVRRLYVIAPELMDAVKQLLDEIYDKYSSTDEMYDQLMTGQNESLVRAVYMIYEISARLLKPDDRQRHSKVLKPSGKPSKDIVTDAFEELRM